VFFLILDNESIKNGYKKFQMGGAARRRCIRLCQSSSGYKRSCAGYKRDLALDTKVPYGISLSRHPKMTTRGQKIVYIFLFTYDILKINSLSGDAINPGLNDI
jgi:hypothetical protein